MGNARRERLYTVQHPEHSSVTVTAQDENAALVAAARVWGEQWTRYQFYAFCEVCPAETKKPIF